MESADGLALNTLGLRQNARHFAKGISKCIFLNENVWRFHWSVFLRFQLIIPQHWFRKWLGGDRATSHYLNQWWLVYINIYETLGLNKLMVLGYQQAQHSLHTGLDIFPLTFCPSIILNKFSLIKYLTFPYTKIKWHYSKCRDHSMYAPSQWEMLLHCNTIIGLVHTQNNPWYNGWVLHAMPCC